MATSNIVHLVTETTDTRTGQKQINNVTIRLPKFRALQKKSKWIKKICGGKDSVKF